MKNILLVEDDAETLMLLHLHFSGPDYTLTVRSHGHDAIEIARKEYFDLVISDIQLPDMEGIDMCRMMTARHINRPVLVMIAHESDKAQALAAGASDCIVKPFSIHELHEKTWTLMNHADRLQMLQNSCNKEESTNMASFNLQQIQAGSDRPGSN